MPETHFPRIALSRLKRSRGPVPTKALYPGFTVFSPSSRFMLSLPVDIGRRHRCKCTVRASYQGRLYVSNFPFCCCFCRVNSYFLRRVMVKRITQVWIGLVLSLQLNQQKVQKLILPCVHGNRNVFWHYRNESIFLL